MNARVYDPELGRFLSADSVVESIFVSQVLNRYTYVGNNPLSYTDMTGHSWLSKFLHRALGPLYGPVVGILTSAIGWALGPLIAGPIASALGLGGWAAAGVNAFVSGAITGGISGGKAFMGALFSGFEAAANLGIHWLKVTQLGFAADGSAINFSQRLQSAGLHGFLGGLMSVARGSNFGSGFLAAAITDDAGPNCHCFRWSTLIGKSVLGGFASVLGGGKFANGAISASFSYLYNDLGQRLRDARDWLRDRLEVGVEVSAGFQIKLKLSVPFLGKIGLTLDGGSFRAGCSFQEGCYLRFTQGASIEGRLGNKWFGIGGTRVTCIGIFGPGIS